MEYTPIIGLEVHAELKTLQKMFCGCKNDPFGAAANTLTCPTCLGLPGALPIPNKKAVEETVLLALALNCEINPTAYFERKHYFYPDLPKGYQISQYKKPLGIGGELTLATGKKIRINRVHLEEDTAKLMHQDGGDSLIDFNRSGVPLVEIVSEPDFNSVVEVDNYLKELQKIIRYLKISDADMEKGSMRLEPTVNLKISRDGKDYFTPLAEIKNVNSFRFVRQAINYEITRQREEFNRTGVEKSSGNKITVGYNEGQKMTIRQREKEEAHDYRYFTEPDIPPIHWEKSQITNYKLQIGELPAVKRRRFSEIYKLNEYQANILVETTERSDYFESLIKAGFTPVKAANLLINKPEIQGQDPRQLLLETEKARAEKTADTSEIKSAVASVLRDNEKAAVEYRAGKKEVLSFLIGQTVKHLGGRGEPKIIKFEIEELVKRDNP